MGEACGDLFLALQQWRLSISPGLHDHVNGGAISLTLSGTYKNHCMRMTGSLAVTTFSVPILLKYILHVHAGSYGAVTTACDFGLKGLGYGSRLPQCGAVSLGKTLHLHVHSLDPGVNGYLDGQRLLMCLNSYQRCDGSRTVCSQGVELVLERTGPITGES